ncbi:MAG TPA: CYTH domain-containing protein, partial [Beijerinckia sp.]|nr:CYTH domain-containing protein [Beijerinckia sp.]
MIGPQETELKFLFSSQDLPKIEATPRLQELLQQAERKRLEATYFDTPNRSLWENGITLRVRKSGKTRVQTLKQATTSDIDRGEWEEEIAQDTLDFDAIEHTPFARLICAPEVRNALAPSFEVDVERASFSLDAAEAQIEGALDQGQIEADGQAIPVCELELELKQGDRIALFEFAR